jgi:hypothetical protein
MSSSSVAQCKQIGSHVEAEAGLVRKVQGAGSVMDRACNVAMFVDVEGGLEEIHFTLQPMNSNCLAGSLPYLLVDSPTPLAQGDCPANCRYSETSAARFARPAVAEVASGSPCARPCVCNENLGVKTLSTGRVRKVYRPSNLRPSFLFFSSTILHRIISIVVSNPPAASSNAQLLTHVQHVLF